MPATKPRWNKETIQELIDSNDRAVAKAVLRIYEAQTREEKHSAMTVESNGVGFSGADAEFGTSLAQQLQSGRTLSPRQLAAARRMIRRYWRQLAALANAGGAEGTAAAPPQPTLDEQYNAFALGMGWPVEDSDTFNRRWIEHKNDFSRTEAAQEAAAYMREMELEALYG